MSAQDIQNNEMKALMDRCNAIEQLSAVLRDYHEIQTSFLPEFQVALILDKLLLLNALGSVSASNLVFNYPSSLSLSAEQQDKVDKAKDNLNRTFRMFSGMLSNLCKIMLTQQKTINDLSNRLDSLILAPDTEEGTKLLNQSESSFEAKRKAQY